MFSVVKLSVPVPVTVVNVKRLSTLPPVVLPDSKPTPMSTLPVTS